MSDHQAINFLFSVDIPELADTPGKSYFSTPILNLEDPLIQEFFSNYVKMNINSVKSNLQSIEFEDNQFFVKSYYSPVSKLLIDAEQASLNFQSSFTNHSRTSGEPGNRSWFTNELKDLKNKIKSLDKRIISDPTLAGERKE